MKRSYLAILTLAGCMAVPAWAEVSAPAQVTVTNPAATTADLPTPPVPPGLPVPLVPPVRKNLPPLTVDITRPLTVEDALTVAFERNPGLRIAVDQSQRAVFVVQEAQANFNPQFNARVTYTRQPAVVSTFSAQPGQPAQSIQIQTPETTTAALTGTLPLDINKRLRYATNIAKYQFDIQYLNLESQAETLVQNTKAAYYNLLRACGRQSVAQAAVDVAKVRLDNTRARFEAGTVPRFDVTTAEVDLANLNQDLITQKNNVELARTALNRVMGIPINNPTQVITVTPTILQTVVDIDGSIATAQERRPEMRAAKASIALNQTNVRLQRTGLLPSMAVSGSAVYNVETSAFSSGNATWQATAVLNIPIWDGGITRARVNEAREDVAISADTYDQTALQVGVDVRTAALNVQEAATRAQTTTEAVALAEEALRLANVRYEAGIATLVEVTNAESQLTQARFNLVNAQYDYAIAIATLQRATSTQPEMNQVELLAIERMHS